MPVTGYLGLIKYLLLLLLFLPALAEPEEQAFWIPREGSEIESYLPRDENLRKHGVLYHKKIAHPGEEVRARDILSQLYRDLDRSTLLGVKDVEWGDNPATLISFRGAVGAKELLGRAVVYQGEGESEVLLLVRAPEADPRLLENFEKLRKSHPFQI